MLRERTAPQPEVSRAIVSVQGSHKVEHPHAETYNAVSLLSRGQEIEWGPVSHGVQLQSLWGIPTLQL